MTDFAALIAMRHPQEFGGLAWSLNLILTLVGSCIAVSLYLGCKPEDVSKLEASTIWAVVGLLLGIWILSLVAFVSAMNRELLPTFYSTASTRTYSAELFMGCE